MIRIGIICALTLVSAVPALAQCSEYGVCYRPYSNIGSHSTSTYETRRGSSWDSYFVDDTKRRYSYNNSRAWDYERKSRSHYNFRDGDRGPGRGRW